MLASSSESGVKTGLSQSNSRWCSQLAAFTSGGPGPAMASAMGVVDAVAIANILPEGPVFARRGRCVRSFWANFHQGTDETEAAAVHRLIVALLLSVVAQGPPRRTDGARNGRIGNEAALPDRLDQFVLRDRPVAPLNQMNE